MDKINLDNLSKSLGNFPVSRETMDKLNRFYDLLLKWQKKINLIAPGEIGHVWDRHILDSAQLVNHLTAESKIIDFGSGAGFPGLILSIFGYDVTLVESDQKKCSFLVEASLATNIKPKILNQRIEDLSDIKFDVVTSRACATLDKLLHLSLPLMNKKSFCLFLKGKNHGGEISVAKKKFSFDADIHPSITDPSGVVLKISNLRST